MPQPISYQEIVGIWVWGVPQWMYLLMFGTNPWAKLEESEAKKWWEFTEVWPKVYQAWGVSWQMYPQWLRSFLWVIRLEMCRNRKSVPDCRMDECRYGQTASQTGQAQFYSPLNSIGGGIKRVIFKIIVWIDNWLFPTKLVGSVCYRIPQMSQHWFR